MSQVTLTDLSGPHRGHGGGRRGFRRGGWGGGYPYPVYNDPIELVYFVTDDGDVEDPPAPGMGDLGAAGQVSMPLVGAATVVSVLAGAVVGYFVGSRFAG